MPERITRFCIVALALALNACAVLENIERELVFRPRTADWAGYSPSILEAEDVWIPVGAGGERLHGWWLASPGAEYTLVYFHGARVNLTGSVYRLRGFRAAGFNVLAVDYRGYGRSSPRLPSEDSVYEDATAAWEWLDQRVPERNRRILYGHSLGGAVAAEVALRGGGAAVLVLESSFTSVADMTRLGGLITQRLDLLDKLRRLDLPVLIVHGAEDSVVPPDMAQRLYEAVRGPKRQLLMVEGAGHSWVARRAGARIYDAVRLLAARRISAAAAHREAACRSASGARRRVRGRSCSGRP